MSMLKSTWPRMAEPNSDRSQACCQPIHSNPSFLCSHSWHDAFVQLWAGRFAHKGSGRDSIKSFAEIQKHYTTKCEQEREIWNTQTESFCMKDDHGQLESSFFFQIFKNVWIRHHLCLAFLCFSCFKDFSMKQIKFQKSKSGVHSKIKKKILHFFLGLAES